MTDYVLVGDEYVPAFLAKNRSHQQRLKFDLLFEEIPAVLRATEEEVRTAWGAKDSKWVDRHLRWRGCVVAVPFRFPLWVRCPHTPTPTGYCKTHRLVRERREA